MRLRLIFSATFFCASALCAETAADYFANGMKFFLRGDFPAAREMFALSKSDSGEYGALSKFYLASIAANAGEDAAYGLFEESLKNPPKDSLNKVAAQYAKYASANGEYGRLARALAPLAESDAADSLTKWYYADALFNSGEAKKAESLWSASLKKCFESADSVGADVFAQSYFDGEKFARSFDMSRLSASTPAALARTEIMEGKKITPPQDKISALAQIALAESGAAVDEKLLAETVYKFRDAPYAWRGSLVLARIAIENKDYKQAYVYAHDAERLAPPDFDAPLFITLGDAARLVKKYDEARYYYQKVFMKRKLRGEPLAESLYKNGLCWFEQGDWGKAHAYFERVYIGFFNFEYWGSRSYYYGACALYSLGLRRDANAVLIEYFRRAKDKNSEIYKEAKKFYDAI